MGTVVLLPNLVASRDLAGMAGLGQPRVSCPVSSCGSVVDPIWGPCGRVHQH